jgi:hypothetical protein
MSAPGSAATVPLLPTPPEQPSNDVPEDAPNKRGLGHDPHEGPEPPRGVEAPNAANDQEPVLGPAQERREDGDANGEAGGEIRAT